MSTINVTQKNQKSQIAIFLQGKDVPGAYCETRMERLYPIDLRTILRILAQQSGELRTSVKVGNSKGECQVFVALLEGSVVSCEIRQKERIILMGNDAFRFLIEKGILEWKYTPRSGPPQSSLSDEHRVSGALSSTPAQIPSFSPSSPENMAATVFPVRVRSASAQEISTWPLALRSVYKLSTGEKSVQELAVLLSTSPDRLMPILQDLMSVNAIRLSRHPTHP